jgi:hypothetical protein
MPILHQVKRTLFPAEERTGRVIRRPKVPGIPARRRYVWLFTWRLAW